MDWLVYFKRKKQEIAVIDVSRNLLRYWPSDRAGRVVEITLGLLLKVTRSAGRQLTTPTWLRHQSRDFSRFQDLRQLEHVQNQYMKRQRLSLASDAGTCMLQIGLHRTVSLQNSIKKHVLNSKACQLMCVIKFRHVACFYKLVNVNINKNANTNVNTNLNLNLNLNANIHINLNVNMNMNNNTSININIININIIINVHINVR